MPRASSRSAAPVKRVVSRKPAPPASVAEKEKPAAPPTPAPASSGDLLSALDHMTVAQLNAVISKAESLRNGKIDGEKKAFVDDVYSRAASLGVAVADLFGFGKAPAKKRGRPAAAVEPAPKRASPPIKFKGPGENDTWTGRGRAPRWLVALEAEGHKREEYAV